MFWYESPKKFTLRWDQPSLEDMLSVKHAPYHMRFLSGKVLLAVLEDGQLCVLWLQNGAVETYQTLPDLKRLLCCDLVVLDSGDVLCVAVSSENIVLLYRIFIATNNSVTVSKVAQWKPSVAGCVKKAILLSDDNMFEVHLMIDSLMLEKWVLTEIQLGLQPRLVKQSSRIQNIVDIAVSNLPFSSDTDSQLLSGRQLVLKQSNGMLACLRRSDYNITSMCPTASESNDYAVPVAKKSKIEFTSPLVVSPSGYCVMHFTASSHLSAVYCGCTLLDLPGGVINGVYVQKLVGVLWGLLLSGQSLWDLAVHISRMQKKSGTTLVTKVIEDLEKVFASQSSSVQKAYIHQYCVLKSTLVRCLNNGMVPSLDVLEDLKFFAAFDFVVSRFPPGEGGQSLAQLATQAVNDAASNAGIDTVSSTITVSGSLGSSTFQIIHLAVKWIMEYTARVVYRVANKMTIRIPEKCVLVTLQQALVLFDKLQPSLPVPKCPGIDNTLACFYRILSLYVANPSVSITKEVVPEVAKIPREDQRQELSHRKAVYLQGFLHGLSDADLPELYSSHGCGIRKNVLQCQEIVNPFTPFTLEVPSGLPPIWTASSPEGERDVVKGNLIPNSALQKSGLLQCSRCHGWSLAGITQLMEKCGPAALTWDQLWLSRCPCGGQWTFKEASNFQ
jgi:hypothetical protein